MKYIIIDDSEIFVKNFEKILLKENIISILQISSDIYQLASTIINEINKSTEVVVICININNRFSNDLRIKCDGILLLKWLRLRNCYNHCILYSFLSLTTIIKQDSLRAILISKGVSYIQLPYIKNSLINIKIEDVKKEDILSYFRAEIDINKIRHEIANLWGAQKAAMLLGLQTTTTNTNYLVEVLKYINTNIQDSYSKVEELISKINKFNSNNKQIFYYDDMSEQWDPILKKLFGDNNVKTFNSNLVTEDQLISQIEATKPACLLLDLRLKNEKENKEVLDYSGGMLLLKLKKIFYSLPIMVFTASNKAESVRALIEVGADYVWTKEGPDNFYNNSKTISNLKTLVNVVQNAVLKYKNEIYEKIFTEELKINKINISDVINNNKIFNDSTHRIFIDANYLIDSVNEGFFSEFYFLIKSKPNNWEVIIHEDVLKELLVISQQDENNTRRTDNYRVPICKFLITKVLGWNHDKLLKIGTGDGQNETLKLLSSKESPQKIDEINTEDLLNERKKFLPFLFTSRVKKELSTIFNDLNLKINEINDQLIDFASYTNIKLHADTTFKKTLPKNLKNSNIVFVSSDNVCAYEVNKELETIASSILQYNDYKVNDEHVKVPSFLSYFCNEKNKTNLYYHFNKDAFNRFFFESNKDQIFFGIVTGYAPLNDGIAIAAFISGIKKGIIYSKNCLNYRTGEDDISSYLKIGSIIKVKIIKISDNGLKVRQITI